MSGGQTDRPEEGSPYSAEFKLTAMKLSGIPGVQVQTVAEALDSHRRVRSTALSMRRWLVAIVFLVLIVSNGAAMDTASDSGSASATTVAVYDPTGQSPKEIQWAPYPAAPPAGFHWQQTGSPAVKVDPATRQPLPGQFTGTWILVRDGYRMPKVRMR